MLFRLFVDFAVLTLSILITGCLTNSGRMCSEAETVIRMDNAGELSMYDQWLHKNSLQTILQKKENVFEYTGVKIEVDDDVTDEKIVKLIRLCLEKGVDCIYIEKVGYPEPPINQVVIEVEEEE